MRFPLTVLCLFSVAVMVGQADIYVDKTRIRIGDQVRATIDLLSDLNGTWVNREHIWPDSMKGIEVVSGPEESKEQPGKMIAIWTLAFFDTGYVRIPKLPVLVQHQGRVDTFYTQDIPIQVLAVEPDSSGLLAIKDIYAQPFSITFYKKYIPHLLGALLLAAGLWYWWKKRKKAPPSAPPGPPPPQPHEWALAALDQLAAQRLWQAGEVKEHYSRLTAILREYLERRFNIHALEQTSEEIIGQLKSLQLTTPLLQDTEELLSVADLIKFAKADPGIDLHAATVERVRAFVKETTIAQETAIDGSPNLTSDADRT